MPPDLTRRAFLGSLGAAGATLAAPGCTPNRSAVTVPTPVGSPDALARDEAHWREVARNWDVTDRVVNLEAGQFLPMATPVLAEFRRHVERVNREGAFYTRGAYRDDAQAVRRRVAESLGVDVEEIALTRGATEALQSLIGGYNRLKRGDAVMYADLDYPAMRYAMNWLEERRGVRVKRIVVPEPATRANVLDAYERALVANRDVRLLLLSHVCYGTGLVLPVAEIVAMARRHDVDVVLDAAHAWGQLDFRLRDLGADFVGFNLHKWIGAPLGAGVLYVKRERLGSIDRMMADEGFPASDVRSRIHSGTTQFATLLTVPTALDFHDAVGPAHKVARLKYLRDRWVQAARRTAARIDFVTPDDMSAAITSFRVRGRTSTADANSVVEELRDRHGVLTVWRQGIAAGDCIRVTPGPWTSAAHVDRLASALRQL